MATRKAPSEIISHWYNLIEGLQSSPKDFYASVEQAVASRQIQGVQMFRVNWPEAGPLSPKREYLRVMRREHTFDICAAPFGNGFFVSWWLGEMPSGCMALLAGIPFVGLLFSSFVRTTYYRIDTALMFQESVRKAVNEAMDQLTLAKGVRALSEDERKPILRSFSVRR